MSCNAFLKCVMLILVFNCKILFAFCIVENRNHVDVLNALLSSSGWKRITKVQTKYGSKVITGIDISNKFDLNVDNSMNVEVNAENFAEKYNLTIQLLACVYANAMVELINLLMYMVYLSSRESCIMRSNVYYNSQKHSIKKRKRLDDEQEALTEASVIGETRVMRNKSLDIDEKLSRQAFKEMLGRKKSWDFLNYALKKLKSLWLAFELISGAISYLVDLIPLRLHTKILVKSHVIECVDELKNVSKNINLLLPDYKCENDINYNKTVGKFTKQILVFFNRVMNGALRPFLQFYCIPSAVNTLNIHDVIHLYTKNIEKGNLGILKKDIPISDIIVYDLGLKIDNLANYVIKNCYSDLGFIYDDNKHTTSVLSLS